MPHVELALTENTGRLTSPAVAPSPVAVPPAAAPSGIERWAAVVNNAAESCLLLDTERVVVAVSAACCELLQLGQPAAVRGQPLLATVTLLDFGDGAALDPAEAGKAPPLLAISSRRLARGLLRVAAPGDKPWRTVDAVATPIGDGSGVVSGSLSFFTDIDQH